jgi:hypothetical protein
MLNLLALFSWSTCLIWGTLSDTVRSTELARLLIAFRNRCELELWPVRGGYNEGE